MKYTIAILISLLPSVTFAANTHHFTCADMSSMTHIGGVSCAGDVFTIPSSGGDALYDGSQSVYPMSGGTNYYLSWTISGGLNGRLASTPSGYDSYPVNIPTSVAYNFYQTYGPSGIDLITTGYSFTVSGFCITDTPGDCEYVPPPDTSFAQQIANATSTFSATTGFDLSAVMVWSADNLVKVFIGSGLAVLYLLRGWIVVILVIAAILFFAYRGFRFFRH